MLYPVSAVTPIQLAQDSSPSCAVLNNGPGNLYLYRNSACSAINGSNDGVIGPGGLYQTAGGALWGISDNSATQCQVLYGAANLNSGSTAISGTISSSIAGAVSIAGTVPTTVGNVVQTQVVGSGGTVTSVRVRASGTGLGSSGSTGVLIPAASQPGDLLIVFIAFGSAGIGAASGWTNVAYLPGAGGTSNPGMYAFTRICTSSGAGSPTTTATFSGAGNYTVFALANATAWTYSSSQTLTSGGALSLITPSITQASGLLVGAMSLGGSVATGTTPPDSLIWGNQAQGGPVNPQAWSSIYPVASSLGILGGVALPNWSVSAAYIAAFYATQSANGVLGLAA